MDMYLNSNKYHPHFDMYYFLVCPTCFFNYSFKVCKLSIF